MSGTRGREEDRRGTTRHGGRTLKAGSVGVYLRRSTRWTSGRALCRTLRRWFPFFFFIFLSLSFPPPLLLPFFSAFDAFLVHSSPPPPPQLSYHRHPLSVLSLDSLPSQAQGLVCRSSGPTTWRTRRHFTTTRRETSSKSMERSIGKFDGISIFS